MCFRRASSLLVLAFVAVLGASSPARAWTRTVVQSARATVEVEPEATLYILLRLDVEVHAGWLHELELVDLGPGVEVDRYRPPYFRSEDGEVFRPEVELHEDGRIRLWFPRREAPRRGEYRVFIRYRTHADARMIQVKGESRVRVVWSVPAWETGLHDVSVELRAPKGTVAPAEMQDTSPGQSFEIVEGPNRTIARWRRIHLPRMTAWPLALDVPEGSIDVPVSAPAAPAPDGFRPLSSPVKRPMAWTLFVLAVLALLKRRSIEVNLSHERLWIRASWPVALTVAALAVLAAQWLAPARLAWGLPLVALALHRPARASTQFDRRTWREASSKELDASDRPSWLDATTPWGAGVLIAFTAVLFALGQPTGSLLLLPIFLSGTRQHRPPTAAEAIASLRTFAGELRLPTDAPSMSFSWERASDGTLRLRVYLPSSRPGLISVGFVTASSATGFLRRRSVMLLIQTRAQSDADDLMRRRTHGDVGVRDADGSVSRLVTWNDEGIDLLRVLAREAPKPVRASRGTWLLREISEPNQKAA
jgi:hypothetical protein